MVETFGRDYQEKEELTHREKSVMFSAVIVAVCALFGIVVALSLGIWKLATL